MPSEGKGSMQKGCSSEGAKTAGVKERVQGRENPLCSRRGLGEGHHQESSAH